MGVREEADHDNSTAGGCGGDSQPGHRGCRLHTQPNNDSNADVVNVDGQLPEHVSDSYRNINPVSHADPGRQPGRGRGSDQGKLGRERQDRRRSLGVHEGSDDR